MISILLTGSMLLSLLPVSALAASPVFDAPAQTTAKKAAPLVQEADASRSTEEEAATRSSRDLDAENGTADSITIQLNAEGKPAGSGGDGNWYYSAASGCQLDTGVFALQPSSEPGAESALKARLFRIGDNAELVRGTVGCETNNYGTISGCSAEGTVTGSVNVGGIAGGSYLGATIVGCYSSAAVEGSSTVGGVVGNLGNNCSLIACYSTGNVTATLTTGYAGGVVGVNAQGSVTACYHATGTVSGQGNVGGIVGMNNNSGQTTACYWSSNPANGIGKMDSGTNGTIKVDGTTVTWQNAVDAMNAALNGSEWRYELTGELPTLKKQ